MFANSCWIKLNFKKCSRWHCLYFEFTFKNGCFCVNLFSSWNKKMLLVSKKTYFYWKQDKIWHIFASLNLTYCFCPCACQSMVIMVYLWRYVTPRPCDFHLVSFQKTNWNEKKKTKEKQNKTKTKSIREIKMQFIEIKKIYKKLK